VPSALATSAEFRSASRVASFKTLCFVTASSNWGRSTALENSPRYTFSTIAQALGGTFSLFGAYLLQCLPTTTETEIAYLLLEREQLSASRRRMRLGISYSIKRAYLLG
jgi:hypothetical protein